MCTENTAFGPSKYFLSRVGSNFIGHNTYTGRRRNFCSKPIPKHEPVHKSELKFSYSRRHLSWLPQVVSKRLINCLSQTLAMIL